MALAFDFPFGRQRINYGNKFGTIVDVTGDSSFVSGGYSITKDKVGLLHHIEGAMNLGFVGAAPSVVSGLAWDNTNKKLQFLAGQIPSIVPSETMTVTSSAGRLAYAPGYIIAARASVGGTTGSLRIIPAGQAPATKQVAVNLVTGTCTFFATDAVTAAVFTYIPLGVGAFIEANRVVDEAIVFGSGAGDTFNLANRAALIQYIWNTTSSTHLPPIQPVGESPATNQIAIDINNSGATTITNNNAQDTNAGLATYWKFSALGTAPYAWTDQADITITSTTLFAFADDLAVPPNGIWVPGFGNVIVGEATATNHQAVLVDAAGTAATDVAVYDPILGKIVPVVGDGYTTIEVPYVIFNPGAFQPNGGELPAGTNLSAVTARLLFIGV